MKRLARFSIPMLGIIVLSSCYVMSVAPTGSINISFGDAGGRTIGPSAVVRVYLHAYPSSNDYSLYTFSDGTRYKEIQYGSGTTSLTNIPVGPWDVFVSIGSYVGGSYQISSYGDSGMVTVFGGMDTPAPVITKAPPYTFSSALAGQSLNGILFDYNGGANANLTPVLYVSSPSALYSITPATAGLPPDLIADTPSVIGLPNGLQIQSLSEGYSSAVLAQSYLGACMFVNGNLAIVPDLGGTFDTLNFSYWLGPSPRFLYTILSSSAVVTAARGVAVYYARNQVFGGVYFDGTTSNTAPENPSKVGPPWVSIDASSKTTGNPVYQMSSDVHTTNGFTYFATVLGAFRADPSFVTASSANAGNVGAMVPISAPNNETIQAIAVDDYDNLLYIGTSHGAYYATLNESSSTSAVSGPWTPIASASGDNIVDIKVDQSNGRLGKPEAVALRSLANNIYTYNAPPAQGGTEKAFPFYSGLPGTVTALDFANGVLFIAGTEGLASIAL